MAKTKLNIIVSATDKASGALKGITGALGKIGKFAATATIAGIGATTAAVAGLTVAVGKLAEEGAALQGIEDAFLSMGDNVVETLDRMRTATAGLATDTDLMKNYNDAALLVGKTFADTLPDVLESITKIAAATGESVDHLMQSFVTGVGRESPMILDNLKIQMGDMSDVVRRWASENRDAAMALVDHTEKIADNNEKVADLQEQLSIAIKRQSEFTETTKESTKAAAQKRIDDLRKRIAALKGEVSSLGDEMRDFSDDEIKQMIDGMDETTRKMIIAEDATKKLVERAATLPEVVNPIGQMRTAWENFGDRFRKVIANNVEPLLKRIAPIVTNFLDIFGRMLKGETGEELFTAFRNLPKPLQILVNVVKVAMDTLKQFSEGGFDRAISFIGFKLQQFLGPDTWAKFVAIKTKFDDLRKWLAEKIPAAIETARGFWEDKLKPAMETVWAFINDKVVPVFQDIWDWLSEKVPAAFNTAKAAIQDQLIPAFTEIIDIVKEEIFPLMPVWIDQWKNLRMAIIGTSGDQSTVNEKLQKFIDIVVGSFAVLGGLLDILTSLQDKLFQFAIWVVEGLILPWKNLAELFGITMPEAIFSLSGAFETLTEWLHNTADAINNLELPDWLTPGSPTPLELGLKGINAEMKKIGGSTLPTFSGGFDRLATAPGSSTVPGRMASGGGGGTTIVNVSGFIIGDQYELADKIDQLKKRRRR